MARTEIGFRNLSKPIDVPTGERVVVVVKGLDGAVLRADEMHFHFDSAVFLPSPDGEAEPGDDGIITGLDILSACYRHAQENAGEKLLIAGHTDPVGTAGYNLTLSQLRANSVLFALTGDKTAWADVADKKHKTEDYQLILKWIASTFGWDTDPGDVDDQDGPATEGAVRSFQARYNDEFGEGIDVDGQVGKQTWGAFFDLYVKGLKDLMEIQDSDLDTFRQGLTFVDANVPAVGCGEFHPVPADEIDASAERPETDRPDSVENAADRRVDLLFFADGHLPHLVCHPGKGTCKPALCEIYKSGHFDIEPILVEGASSTRILVYEWPDSLTENLPDDLVLRLLVQGGEPIDHAWTDGELIDDFRRFVFDPVAKGVTSTLSALTGGNEIVLWRDQLTDNPTEPPLWESTLQDLSIEAPTDGDVTDVAQIPPEESDNVQTLLA